MGWGGGEMMVVAVGGGWEDRGTGRLWATSISWLHFTIVVYLFSLTHICRKVSMLTICLFSLVKLKNGKGKNMDMGNDDVGSRGRALSVLQ